METPGRTPLSWGTRSSASGMVLNNNRVGGEKRRRATGTVREALPLSPPSPSPIATSRDELMIAPVSDSSTLVADSENQMSVQTSEFRPEDEYWYDEEKRNTF